MSRKSVVMLLNLPSPPYSDVFRDWAGGFGTATPVRKRDEYGHSSDPFFYPFFAYASAVLHKENCDYTVLDGQKLKLAQQHVMKAVEKENPDVIFSILGLPSLGGDLSMLNSIKDALPNTTIVCVGTSCKVLQQEIFARSKVDFLSTSAYPYVSNIALLLEALEQRQDIRKVPSVSYVKEERIITNAKGPEQNLNELIPPRYHDLDLSGYECFRDYDGDRYSYIPVLGSQGCSYACYYCPYPLGFGMRWNGRSPESIVNEIEYLSSRGVHGLMFRDQSFPMDEKRAIKICDLIIDRKLDVPWFCEARVDHLNRRILGLMRKAGCKAIQLGVETGDEVLIKEAKPQADLGIIRRAFRLTKEFHLCSMAHIIFGWPDETIETMKRTGRFVGELAPERVNWNFLTPYPGTRLHEIAKAYDLILTYDWSKYTSHTVVMRTKWLSANQIWTTGRRIIRNHRKNELIKLLPSVGKRPQFVLSELKSTLGSLIQ